MDPLTQVIELLRPKALLWKHIEGHDDWAIRFPQESGVVFGFITAGSCYLEMQGIEPTLLCAGDYLLLAAPPSWVLRSGNAAVPVDFEMAHADQHRSITAVGDGMGPDICRITGGHFVFETANGDLLAGLLSPVVHFRSSAGATCRLRLALRELHADVRRDWTVRALASCAGISRSVFAERFNRIVGVTPIDYLLNWRMALAKDALQFSNRPLADIALAIGYQSANAFSTAFSRVVGSSPAKYSARRSRLR